MKFANNGLTIKRVTGGVRFAQDACDEPYRAAIDVMLDGPSTEELIYALRISMKMFGDDATEVFVRRGLSAVADGTTETVLTLGGRHATVRVGAAPFADALELLLETWPGEEN